MPIQQNQASDAGEEIAIAEGIETALAVLCIGRGCWEALSASVMRRIVLPAQIRKVFLLEENDQPAARRRRASPDTVRALGQRLLGEGREVIVVRLPAGFKDMNEVLMSRRPRDAA